MPVLVRVMAIRLHGISDEFRKTHINNRIVPVCARNKQYLCIKPIIRSKMYLKKLLCVAAALSLAMSNSMSAESGEACEDRDFAAYQSGFLHRCAA